MVPSFYSHLVQYNPSSTSGPWPFNKSNGPVTWRFEAYCSCLGQFWELFLSIEFGRSPRWSVAYPLYVPLPLTLCRQGDPDHAFQWFERMKESNLVDIAWPSKCSCTCVSPLLLYKCRLDQYQDCMYKNAKGACYSAVHDSRISLAPSNFFCAFSLFNFFQI